MGSRIGMMIAPVSPRHAVARRIGQAHARPVNGVRAWSGTIILVVVVVIILGLIGVYRVPSMSMTPTLDPGDRVIGVRTWGVADALVQRGDVIVFRDDEGRLSGASDEGDLLVKRVIGVAGDHIQCVGGSLMVNGEEIIEPWTTGTACHVDGMSVTVPAGRLFVMGDDRAVSTDSTTHLTSATGTIARSSVIAILIARVWPVPRVGVVHDYGDYYRWYDR